MRASAGSEIAQIAAAVRTPDVNRVHLNRPLEPVELPRNRDGRITRLLPTSDLRTHAAIKGRLVAAPSAFIELLPGLGANPNLRNGAGWMARPEALRRLGAPAETYGPARLVAAA